MGATRGTLPRILFSIPIEIYTHPKKYFPKFPTQNNLGIRTFQTQEIKILRSFPSLESRSTPTPPNQGLKLSNIFNGGRGWRSFTWPIFRFPIPLPHPPVISVLRLMIDAQQSPKAVKKTIISIMSKKMPIRSFHVTSAHSLCPGGQSHGTSHWLF